MMKRILLLGLFVAVHCHALGTAQAQRQANLAQDRDAVANGWQFDYEAAKALARRTNKPLMVVFRCVP